MRLPDRSNLILLFVLLLALAVLALGLADTSFSRALLSIIPAPREGAAAPDFTLPTLDEGTITLSDLRGQVVVINLWTSWCPPCRAEMPALNDVFLKYRDDGLIVLAVNSSVQDSRAAAEAFASEYQFDFPILLDLDGTATRTYQLQSLPTTYFVDRRGVIRAVVPGGPMSAAFIEAKIKPLLAESRAP